MSELIYKSASELSELLENKEISSVELTNECFDQIDKVDDEIGAFLRTTKDSALETAKEVDNLRVSEASAGTGAADQSLNKLAGIPIALKDIVVTKGIETTNASKILEGWIPVYDATIVEKIKAAKLPILGKTNMDEFAMGSSTETSGYQVTHNPWGLDRIPGGSSGGSASAVSSFETPLAIGTDTGGSIRQPAAVTGTVGIKPTYGTVSRYGLIAMASSLDQAGPMTRTVLDSALLQEVIQGHDHRESTSLPDFNPKVVNATLDGQKLDLKGKKVGVIQQLHGEGFDKGILDAFDKSVQLLKDQGAEIVEISMPSLKYSLGAYYIIMPCEASSNLAKFDGMRFGKRWMPEDKEVTAENMMMETRQNGFGWETKRRILLGTYALSAGFYDAYYMSAQKVRTLLLQEFNKAFDEVDVLICPTSPTPAFKLGEKFEDPMTMYRQDIATIPVNLAGLPAGSIPNGLADGLPSSIQVIANQLQDEKVYYYLGALEKLLNFDNTKNPYYNASFPARSGISGVNPSGTKNEKGV
jgi:aspartyl-tRNA(Asn)/glutamyl-tRNA(Gln) amidotransferase subunit A